MTDDDDDHQHFEEEPTLHNVGPQHLDVIAISANNHPNDDAAQQQQPASEKSGQYSDDEEDDDDDDDEDDEEEDALVRATRLSRRHSSAGAIPMSLTASSSVVSGRGLVRERSTPTRRCRIDEEQQRNQSASARPAAAVINNNVGGNWLNVPGAVDMSASKKNKSSQQKNNVSIERLELVPTFMTRNKSSTSGAASLAPSAGRRLQQNNSLGVGGTTASNPPSLNLSFESGSQTPSKELLRHHRQQSTSQHHHVRSQSVRVAPRSTTTTTSNRNNNINSSTINQQKSFTDYNSFQQHQQSIKVRPRGTSLPGTNRALADPTATTTSSSAFADEGQQYYGNNQQQQTGGEDDEADYYLLRHFIVHGKSNKVVNRGDSFRRSLRTHKQQQQSSAISQHSSTSSIR
jgi:hypothetical protein